MKYKIEDVIVEEWYYNKHNNISSYDKNEISESFKTNYELFPNKSNNKMFILKIHCDYTVKNKDKIFNIASFITSQKINILFEGINDKEVLRNAISTAYMHVREEYELKVKDTAIENLSIPTHSNSLFVDDILNFVQSNNSPLK